MNQGVILLTHGFIRVKTNNKQKLSTVLFICRRQNDFSS